MKNMLIFSLLFFSFVGTLTINAVSKNELRTCAICSQSIPKNNVVLSCEHKACVECLQPWLDKKATCMRCQEKKQRFATRRERWQTLARVGFGGLLMAGLIVATRVDAYLEKRSLSKG